MAVQCIRGNDTAFEVQQAQDLQGARCLVAARGLALSQAHSRFRRPDVDHVQRGTLPAALEGTPQGFAVHRHHAAQFQSVGLGEACHEPAECGLERLRVQQAEDPAEGIVAGHPVLQLQDQSQQPFFGLPKRGHVRGALGATQCRRKSNEQNLQQLVPCVVRPRVRQPSKSLLEISPSDSTCARGVDLKSILCEPAIPASNPYAIPLPLWGGVRGGGSRYFAGYVFEHTVDLPRDDIALIERWRFASIALRLLSVRHLGTCFRVLAATPTPSPSPQGGRGAH